MQDVQSIFNDIQDLKKEQKEIRKEYKADLASDKDYEKILDDIKQLKIKKEQIELSHQSSMGTRYDRLDDITRDVKEQEQMLNDVAITTLMDGKTVEVTDKFNTPYEPVWKVSFKKVK